MPPPAANQSHATVSPERQAKVDAARKAWISRLVDMSRRNNLLFYRDTKTGTLDISGADGDAVRRLLQSGRSDADSVRLTDLIVPERRVQASASLAEIARRAQINYEERGLDTMFLAMGMATWAMDDGGRPTSAPVVLVPVTASQIGGRSGQWQLRRKGDVKLNDVLAHALKENHGVGLPSDELMPQLLGDDEGEAFDLQPLFAAITARAGGVPEFSVSDRLVVGNFAFQKMAIVKDLQELSGPLAAHDLIAGIAGDSGASQSARGGRASMDPRELDRLAPDEEFLIRDADSSQQQAIALTLRGQNGVISGPPGTGKSQTISNLIAELVARGKTVLFVAEKRAALDVVLNRLDNADLGHLCLDCHGAELTRRRVAEQFKESLERVREAPAPDVATLHRRFVERRDQLNAHARDVHRERAPWGISLHTVYGRLLALPDAAACRTRLPKKVVAAIDERALEAACNQVEELAELAPLVTGELPSPWSWATFTQTDDVRRALERARRLAHDRWPRWVAASEALLRESGLRPPQTLGETTALLELLTAVDETLQAVRPEFYAENLATLAAALAPAASGLGGMWAALTNGDYRAALRAVRAHALTGKVPAADALNLAADGARTLEAWRSWSLDGRKRPAPLSTFAAGRTTWDAVFEDLDPLMRAFRGGTLDQLAPDTLGSWLTALAADPLTPSQLLKVHELEVALASRGLAPVLSEITEVKPAPDLWPAMLRGVWLRSCLEELQLEDPGIPGFAGRKHDRIAEEFRHLDKQRLEVAVQRVQRAHALRALEVRNKYPDQNVLVGKEASKRSRHLPLRRLFDEAPAVLLALRPCWMASPLSVSQLIPGRPLFDVVIFDEASQVLPEDAVTSLLRGQQAVIAGDQRQLPPTTFFATGDGDGDSEDDNATAGFQSILDAMSAFLDPPWSLDWHYRSQDEALIAYSNHRIYNGRLVTFPGPGGVGAVRHELVPHVPGVGAQDASVGAEVLRVVELVRQHAVEQPDASLGVITMGIEHARRIEMALDRARQDDPALELLFSDDVHERFFVKNLERVQGDERDAIILSIGYGKDDSGQLVYRFGPLLQEGGERRLNVAITRARQQMTVVSSFSHHDVRADYPKLGVQLLRGFLEYAASNGQRFERGQATHVALNEFEQSVFDELTGRGLKLVGQVGSSRYRIDMVAMHPEQEGRYVLAIECDGASYHSAPTARDRDRLRQQQLEALGWRFHRIWSTDWFERREEEVQRVLHAFQQAVNGDTPAAPEPPPSIQSPAERPPDPPAAVERSPAKRVQRPPVPQRDSIDEYLSSELRQLVRWVRSDGMLHTDQEIVAEVTRELGFRRRGAKIVAAIEAAIRAEGR
ncbi:MAG: AAA domain-containing protein [Vicinamibacterales bacterium]